MMRLRLCFISLLFFLSGAAGLGYELVWTRMLSVGLGHEFVSVLAVVAAFFGGLALGGWALHRRMAAGSNPGYWYAALELVIGLWALALIRLIPWLNQYLPKLIPIYASIYHQWTIAFLTPFLLLLPATFSMGGTFPAMERMLYHLSSSKSTVGGLYATNTFGAVSGTLCITYFVIPALGFSSTQFGRLPVRILKLRYFQGCPPGAYS
jgi:spermidine synthase